MAKLLDAQFSADTADEMRQQIINFVEFLSRSQYQRAALTTGAARKELEAFGKAYSHLVMMLTKAEIKPKHLTRI